MFDTKAPTKLNYKEEGLLVGLEFHQQLLAPYFKEQSKDEMKRYGSKLFCSCLAKIQEKEPDFTVERQLRAVAGETGKVDVAAKFETLKKRRVVYEGYNDTTCLVELDEEPIFPINPVALLNALIISKRAFNLKLFDEFLVCRKTIVDGSNTSGFQRTMQIAYGDKKSVIKIDGKPIILYQANLEEDSCKNTGQHGAFRSFRLDRLGIPLIEIATEPDMNHPDEVKATAQRIGNLLRSTGLVKRGLGTIRQDINVSIVKGTRVEIKGVSELELLPLYVQNEAVRQHRMLEFLAILKKKGLFKLISKMKAVNVSSVFQKTKSKFISRALEQKMKVVSAKLPMMKGLLEFELQTNYRVGTELSEIAKVTSGAGGVVFSYELKKIEITISELKKLSEALKLGKSDAFLLVVGSEKVGKRSVMNIMDAFKLWMNSPNLHPEVRAPRPDGTTGFLRPLPGKARMYPETDSHQYNYLKSYSKTLKPFISNYLKKG